MSVTIRTFGGPTTLVEIGGRRLLIDPTFDEPRDYDLGGGRVLTKTQGPALIGGEIGPLDAVLLSHDQHADNLDDSGRALLAAVRVTYTTPLGAERLGGTAVGLNPWETASLGDAHDHRRARPARARWHRAPRRSRHRLRPVGRR